ncbi:MAG: HAD family hydrolase [Clostridiaceae bacterium]|nr:HAD family hydrolase [Clostridiaceae bacterium]
MKGCKAWFLDRDGTIIEDCCYLGDPSKVRLLENAAEALRLAQEAGYLLIVVTNQSGIGRGYFTEEAADRVDQRMAELLEEYGVKLTACYRCPHWPGGYAPYNVICDCRKPKTGLFQKAIADYDIDPEQSIACGDKLRDIERLPDLGIQPKHLGVIAPDGYPNLLSFFLAVHHVETVDF